MSTFDLFANGERIYTGPINEVYKYATALGLDIDDLSTLRDPDAQPHNRVAVKDHTFYRLNEVNIGNKIPAVKFDLSFHEGVNIGACGLYYTWYDLYQACLRIGRTHQGQGDIKTDITVYYANGETYESRPDITPESVDLGFHMMQYMKYHAGLYRPPHLTTKQYDNFIRTFDPAPYLHFLNVYEIVAYPDPYL